MKIKQLQLLASTVLALCLAHCALAQTNDDHWDGTPTNNLWNVPGNWSKGFVPIPGGPGFAGNVWLDAANGDSLMVIPPGDVETPGVPPPGSPEEFNTIFGPEFGASLHIYGSLTYDWFLFPTQNDPNPATRTYLNFYTNSTVFCVGASGTGGAAIGIGDSYFYTDGPYVTANMYANSQYTSPGAAGFWLGGHLNIYDNAIFSINGYVNMDVAFAQTDGTRSLVLGGGTLILPENSIFGGNSGSVSSWITRGILRPYGKGEDTETNDINITDNGTNTIVTVGSLGGALEDVYFLPLVHSTLNVGDFEQSSLVGDYPLITAVLLGSSEPGLSPGSFPQPVYTSSNPEAVTVDTNGLVTAVGYGTSTLTAKVGGFTSTNSLAITVAPVVPIPIHRYSFNEAPGSTNAADSIGGADGAVNTDATFTGKGQLVLNGNVDSSVTLPAGILSGLDEVTIEAWATFPSTINPYANLFAFGFADTNAGDANVNDGGNYITLSPHTGAVPPTVQANFGQGLPGFNGERDAVMTGVLDNETNVQIVAVFHPLAGFEAVYINGVNVATISMFNNLIDPVAAQGPTYNGGSILAYTLGADLNNYIGQSLYAGDPGLLANIDEFRIYNVPLSPAQIAADHALGPNQLIGTSTSVKLTATSSNGNIVIKWPTTSALITVVGSPALGAGAVWTPVTNGTLTTDGSGNYEMTIPTTLSARFFRLEE